MRICRCGQPTESERYSMCTACAKDLFKIHLSKNITPEATSLPILVGDLKAKESALTIEELIQQNPHITTITLQARGRHISKAVDILEILKQSTVITDVVLNTETEELINEYGNPIRVSGMIISACIALIKKRHY